MSRVLGSASFAISADFSSPQIKAAAERVNKQVAETLKNQDISVGLDSAKLDSEIKKAALKFRALDESARITPEMKTAKLDAQIAETKVKLLALGGSGTKTGEKYADGVARGINSKSSAITSLATRSLGTVTGAFGTAGSKAGHAFSVAAVRGIQGGAIAAAVAGSLKALPALFAFGGGAAAVALGGALLVGTKKSQGPLYKSWQDFTRKIISTGRTAALPLVTPFQQAFAQFEGQLPKIGKLLTGTFQAAAPLVKPLVGMLAQIAENILPGFNAMLRQAAPGITVLAKALGGVVATNIGKFFKNLGPGITASANALSGVLGFVSGLLPPLGSLASTLANGVGKALRQVLPFLETLAKKVLPVVVGLFQAVAPVIGQVAGAMIKGLQPAVKPLVQVFKNLAGPLGQVAGALGGALVAAIKAFAPIVVQLLPPLSKIAGNMLLLAAGIIRDLMPVIPPLVKVLGVVARALAIVLVPLSGWLKANPKLVEAVIGFYLAWKGYKAVTGAIGAITGSIKKLRGAFALLSAQPWILIVAAIIIAAVLIIKYHTQIWKFVTRIWGDIVKFLKNNWKLIVAAATGTLGLLVFVIIKYHETIWKFILRIWNDVLKFFKGIWGHIENVFTGALKSIGNWVSTGWNSVYSNTSRTWSKIANFFSRTWDGIKSTARKAVDWVGSKLAGAWDLIKRTASRAWGGIAGAIGKAFTTIQNLVKSPVNWVLHNVIDRADSAINSVFHLKLPTNLSLATGGKIPGWDNGDRVPAMLEGGEAVVPKRLASSKAFSDWAGANGIPGYAKGGIPILSPVGHAIASGFDAARHGVAAGTDALVKAIRGGVADAVTAPLNGLINAIPGTGLGLSIAKAMGHEAVNALKSLISGQQAKAAAAAAIAGGPAGGATGSEMANGRELYNYLLKNLFGGNKIAAAGATASIWGESTWNPFAQGTGGRGLLGWTPAGTISNAAFSGGMRTQLPAIIQFVNRSGDQGAIAQMKRAGSVLAAANIWGRQVERFGINDVHSTGIRLATSFMARGGKVFDKGGTLAPGPNLVYNKTGAPEHLVPVGGSTEISVKLDFGPNFRKRTGLTEEEIADIRHTVSRKGGNVQKTFGRH